MQSFHRQLWIFFRRVFIDLAAAISSSTVGPLVLSLLDSIPLVCIDYSALVFMRFILHDDCIKASVCPYVFVLSFAVPCRGCPQSNIKKNWVIHHTHLRCVRFAPAYGFERQQGQRFRLCSRVCSPNPAMTCQSIATQGFRRVQQSRPIDNFKTAVCSITNTRLT